MKVLTIIQARTGSTRLPGKVLLPLGDRPLLVRMVERVRAAKLAGDVVVATTRQPQDDQIRALCARYEIPCVVGHPTDLLDRHHQAWRARGGDVVVKIPSDCPLIDPKAIDRVLGGWAGHDYLSNLHPQSWPDGNDVEAVSPAALAIAHREAHLPHEREHTTPFLVERPDRFRLGNVAWETGRDFSRRYRYTLDYGADYALISQVFDALYPTNPHFGAEEICAFLESRADVRMLNARYLGETWVSRMMQEDVTCSLP